MSYIKNSSIGQGNKFNLSGSSIHLTGSLTGSEISGTLAQFTTISGSVISASEYQGPIITAGGDNTFTGVNIFNVSSSSPAVKIIQRGTGAALRVEDMANDQSPFVVTADGKIGIGTDSPGSTLNGVPHLDITTDINTKVLVRTAGALTSAAYGLQSTGKTNNPYMEMELVSSNTDQQSVIRFNYLGATNKNDLLVIKGDGNVGIGLNIPSEKLQVSGVIHAVSGGVKFPDGTLQTTAFVTGPGGSALTGLGTVGQIAYFGGTTDITSENGVGANALTWDSTNNRLGIGTSTPTKHLEVSSSQNASTEVLVVNSNSGNAADARFSLKNDANKFAIFALGSSTFGNTPGGISSANAVTVGGSSISALLFANYGTAAPIHFIPDTAASVPALSVLTNGNAGIGISTPTAKLQVAGTVLAKNLSNSTTAFQVQDSAGTVILDVDTVNDRVGIGTATPSALFSVGGSNQFQVNTSGDIIKIKNVSYLWPSSAPTQNNLVLSVSDFNTGQLAWVAGGGGGGSATPVGPNQSIQFNSGSQFSGSANFLWNYTSNSLLITGSLIATTKSFDIVHPTKEGMRLRYGSLEGPENGVYVRGVTTESVIELPEHWLGLVDEETITVNLTPIGIRQTLWVKDIKDNKVYIGGKLKKCHFTVFAERKDVSRLVVEY